MYIKLLQLENLGMEPQHIRESEINDLMSATNSKPTTSPSSDAEEEILWKPRLIHIEVVFLFTCVGWGLEIPTLYSLMYDKTCFSNFHRNICENLGNSNSSNQEDVVQSTTSYWIFYYYLVNNIPPIGLIFVYGTMSDKLSRRAIIAVPCAGHLLGNLNNLLMAIFMDSHVAYSLVGAVVSGLCGGWVALYMAVFGYLGEVTPEKNRTLRVSIALGVSLVSFSGAYMIAGFVYDHTSYVVVFSLSSAAFGLSVPYTYMWIREPPRKARQPGTGRPDSKFGLLWYHIKDAVAFLFEERPNNGRTHLLVCLLAVLLGSIGYSREYSLHTVKIVCRLLDYTLGRPTHQRTYSAVTTKRRTMHLIHGAGAMVSFPRKLFF